jgi:ubiquinone/menaquinone biosynthesis C-methylase UbiE
MEWAMKHRGEGWYDSFFTGVYSRVLGAQFDPRHSLQEARMVRKLLKVRRGDKVLDVPCGKGRLTIPLARLGMDMTGVDLTAPYLATARRHAKREGVSIRFVRSDMRDIDFDGEFAAVFNWFGSFGYFSDDDNLLFCQRVLRALKPGGRFLVEGLNKSWIKTHFRPKHEQEHGGVLIRISNRWDAKQERIKGTWTFIRGDRRERQRTDMRIFGGAEMRALLRSAGFREIELYGRPPLSRFTRHSRRLMAVARKPR